MPSKDLLVYCTFIALFFVAILDSTAIASTNCEHFFKVNDKYVKSGLTVGEDVGEHAAVLNEGYYSCTVDRDPTKNYLYVGEVGDSSYLVMESENGPYVFRHGLYEEEAVYTRYLPFFIDLTHIRTGDNFSFKLFYKNIFPYQVGLRSGEPSQENFKGVMKRFFDRSFLTLLYLVYIFALLILFFLNFLKSRNSRGRRMLMLCNVGAVVSLFQLTAIPRTFIPSDISYLLNEWIQVSTLGLITFTIFHFFEVKAKFFLVYPLLIFVVAVFQFLILPNDSYLNTYYAIALFLCSAAPVSHLLFAVLRGQAVFLVHKVNIQIVYLALFTYCFVDIYDIINMIAFTSKHYYLTPGLIYLPFILFLEVLVHYYEKNKHFIYQEFQQVRHHFLEISQKNNSSNSTFRAFRDILGISEVTLGSSDDKNHQEVGKAHRAQVELKDGTFLNIKFSGHRELSYFKHIEKDFKEYFQDLIKVHSHLRNSNERILLEQANHDIKSPLAVLEFLGQSLKGDDLEQGMYRRALGRISEIISNSSPELEKTLDRLNIEALEKLIFQVVEEKAALCDLEFAVKNHVLTEATEQMVVLNRVEFERVISNLLNNSIDASENSKGSVSIDIYSDSSELSVALRDNGVGIDKENLPRLFKRKATFNKEKGQGLGLWHAKETIESFGGTVEISSEVNTGTEVKITLPLFIAQVA